MGRLADLKLAPGFVRPGTRREAKGRWYSGSLVRWYEAVMQAVGGWTALLDSSDAAVVLDGPVRGMHDWQRADVTVLSPPQLAMGTTAKLWHFASGVTTDITPTDFVSGGDDPGTETGAYGAGPYGVGPYGSGSSTATIEREAQSWQFDNYGEDLVAVAYSDKRLHYWSRATGGPAAPLENAPACMAVVTTDEGFILALGASDLDDGTIDARQIRWPDEINTTTWAATLENQAGQHKLPGKGRLLAGKRGRGEVLIWTDNELYRGRFVGGTFVYLFAEVGSNVGAISRRSMAVVDGVAYWMGKRGFFRYDGYHAPLPSDVGDFVFNDLNEEQASKIHTAINSQYGEVTWYYCSAGSTEIDRYVTFNYRGGIWYFGALERTAWVDSGVFALPMAGDSSGNIYTHETGESYLDTDGETTLVPNAESGPVEIGGGKSMRISQLVPDEATLGDVVVSLIASDSPTSSETTFGPFTAAQPTPVRIETRYVRVKLAQVEAGWRYGTLQLELVPAGSRR